MASLSIAVDEGAIVTREPLAAGNLSRSFFGAGLADATGALVGGVALMASRIRSTDLAGALAAR